MNASKVREWLKMKTFDFTQMNFTPGIINNQNFEVPRMAK